MTLATAPIPTPSILPEARGARERVLLTNVSWETYRRLREECGRERLKMTFDRGRLEIMPPLPIHELATRYLDQIVTMTGEELRIRLVGYRGTTWQKEALERGLEADECYYIQHAAMAEERGADIDIERDPPPDLAIETDVTHSTVDKEAVYAGLGVPELWRWDNGTFRIRILGSDGRYADSPSSKALPMLPPATIEEFVRQRIRGNEWDAKMAFREWIRQTFPPASQA